MPAIEGTITLLRQALGNLHGTRKHLKDVVDDLASCLVLLNSSRPSSQSIEKLRSVLLNSLPPLYDACLGPTLLVSSAILSVILEEKICDAYIHGDTPLRREWDKTANVVLSGVLDYLDERSKDGNRCKVSVGESFCPVICKFFFRDHSQLAPQLSMSLCISAYSILGDVAHGDQKIQDTLRDKAIMGPVRLGSAISNSKDYLILETLLALLARLLPPRENTSEGRSKRYKFIEETLGSPRLFTCGKELVSILLEVSSPDWDIAATQLIDALARSDIMYPQPFSIDEINACGQIFPQPSPTDRLILDRRGFLANVILSRNDIYESIEISYSHVQTVTMDTSNAMTLKKTSVTLALLTPPRIGGTEMEVDGPELYLKFMVDSEDLKRFMEALRRRGVGKLSFVNSTPKMNKPHNGVSLASEMDFTGDGSLLLRSPNFEEKIKHVKQVYETDIDDVIIADPCRDRVQGEGISTLRTSSPKASISVVNENLDTLVEDKAIFDKRPTTRATGNQVGQGVLHQDPEKNLKPTGTLRAKADPALRGGKSGKRCSNMSNSKKPSNPTIKRAAKRKRMADRTDDVVITSAKGGVENGILSDHGTPNDEQLAIATSVSSADRVQPKGHVSMEVSRPDQSGITHKPDIQNNTEDNESGGCDFRSIHPLGDFDENQLEAKGTTTSDEGAEKRIRGFLTIVADIHGATTLGKRHFSGDKVAQDVTASSIFELERGPPQKSRKILGGFCPNNKGIEYKNSHVREPENVGNLTNPENGKNKSNPSIIPFSSVTLNRVPFGFAKERFDNSRMENGEDRSASVRKGTKGIAMQAKSRSQTKALKVSDTEKCDIASVDESTEPVPVDSKPSSIATAITLASVPKASVLPALMPTTTVNRRSFYHSGLLDSASPHSRAIRFKPQGISNNLEPTCQIPTVKTEASCSITSDLSNAVSLIRTSKLKRNGVNRNTPSDSDNQMEDITSLEHPTPLNDNDNIDKPIPPFTNQFLHEKQVVTIDLTQSGTPEPIKLRSRRSPSTEGNEAKHTVMLDTSEKIHESPISAPSPPRKRLSVAFASPIEQIVQPDTSFEAENTQNTRTQSSIKMRLPPRLTPSDNWNFSEHREKWRTYIDDDDALSPRPAWSNSQRYSNMPVRALPSLRRVVRPVREEQQVKNTSREVTTSGEVDIQDIVEVLNEIQAVIIKGISNKFENARRGVRACREELVQEYILELKLIETANARQFNDLVELEEEYHKYHKIITRGWDDIIRCTENISTQFKKTVEAHDLAARAYPPSLLPKGPLFSRRKAIG